MPSGRMGKTKLSKGWTVNLDVEQRRLLVVPKYVLTARDYHYAPTALLYQPRPRAVQRQTQDRL